MLAMVLSNAQCNFMNVNHVFPNPKHYDVNWLQKVENMTINVKLWIHANYDFIDGKTWLQI